MPRMVIGASCPRAKHFMVDMLFNIYRRRRVAHSNTSAYT